MARRSANPRYRPSTESTKSSGSSLGRASAMEKIESMEAPLETSESEVSVNKPYFELAFALGDGTVKGQLLGGRTVSRR